MGKRVSELVAEGLLDPLCEQIFQKNGKSFHLYHHQEEAVRLAAQRTHYVLTTGTGSGKSLTYLIPIIHHILTNDPGPEQVRALIVYPMNALINSQEQEIRRLLDNLGEEDKPIRFGRYTGQENQEERERLQQHPPHILLTNYVMLELMMSRPKERVFLDQTLSKLEFLVLDELHTYTGRQGADVSMLVRRVRQRCGNKDILCIGTSATMIAGGTREEQRAGVAEVASKIFGVPVSPENIVDERLKQSIRLNGEVSADKLRETLASTIPGEYDSLVDSPLAAWLEQTFGIQREEGFYRRRTPITLGQGAEKLAELTGLNRDECEERIRQALHSGSQLSHPDGTPVFAVRLHQFISKGESVYASLEPTDQRHLTLTGQRFVRSSKRQKDLLLAPLVFCRVCGQEYYRVNRNEDKGLIEPRNAEIRD